MCEEADYGAEYDIEYECVGGPWDGDYRPRPDDTSRIYIHPDKIAEGCYVITPHPRNIGYYFWKWEAAW